MENYLQKNYPEYDCDEDGNVFKDGKRITPFRSNKYLQVCLFDGFGKKRVVGVHTVVAMKYLNYFEGCTIHHINENAHDNSVSNLQVMSRSDHSRTHGLKNETFKRMNRGKTPWNKGMKMSDEFRRKCSMMALRRNARERGEE